MKCDERLNQHRCIEWCRRCLLCHGLYPRHDGISNAVRVCTQCWNLVQYNRLKEMVHATDGERVHCSLYQYINEARDLLWHYKFNAIKSIADVYARAVGDGWIRWFEGCALVPVPASVNNIKHRGWDQVLIIAKKLAVIHSIEILPLIQRTGTQATKKMNRERRLSAVQKQYSLSNNLKNRNSQAHRVVLFDDVFTTGATITTCSSILQQQGLEVCGSLTLYRS